MYEIEVMNTRAAKRQYEREVQCKTDLEGILRSTVEEVKLEMLENRKK